MVMSGSGSHAQPPPPNNAAALAAIQNDIRIVLSYVRRGVASSDGLAGATLTQQASNGILIELVEAQSVLLVSQAELNTQLSSQLEDVFCSLAMLQEKVDLLLSSLLGE